MTMRHQELANAISKLMSDVEEYITSNKEWIYYFTNPLCKDNSANKTLYDLLESHPFDWEDYLELSVVSLSGASVGVNISFDDEGMPPLTRYIILPLFERTIQRNKSVSSAYLKTEKIQHLQEEIDNLKTLIAIKEDSIRQLKAKE